MPLKYIQECYGAARSQAVFSFGADEATRLVVMPNHSDLNDVAKEIEFFSGYPENRILVLPDLETLPYDLEAPSAFILSKRAEVFYRLSNETGPFVVVTNVNALMMYVADKGHWNHTNLALCVGDVVDREAWSESLVSMGYVNQPVASWPGHFCIHPNVMDIFPIGSAQASRIRFEDGKISAIQNLDVRTQRSKEFADSLICLPAREVSALPAAITNFRKQWRESFDEFTDPTYEAVSKREFPVGIEYYTSLFSSSPVSVFDYLPDDHEIFVVDGAFEEIDRHWKAIVRRYQDLQADTSRRILPPDRVWISSVSMYERLEGDRAYYVGDSTDESASLTLSCHPNNVVPQDSTKEIVSLLSAWNGEAVAVVVILSTKAKLEQVKMLALLAKMPFKEISSWTDAGREAATSAETLLCVAYGMVEQGFYSEENSIVYVTEKDLFGHATAEKTEDLAADEDIDLNDFLNIKRGDRLVHLKYGIGAFRGTQSLEHDGVAREYFTIEYADDAKAFVKMEDLDQVSRFGAIKDGDRPLDVMGTEDWLKDLDSATSGIGITAASLLRIQRERLEQKGIVIKPQPGKYIQFSNEFPFDETQDQKRAIKDIEADLASQRPMDRVVIGDVGFGKTEVAARAAFCAASAGYQVVILVPTTLLAQQHYENFRRRFASFPEIGIVGLSRNTEDEREVLRALRTGDAKIVIGTHRLIQDDVRYQNLGLIIVDEEHRFGVAQKEKLRHMRTTVNMLAMSATPIPRTLSFSLMGIRDVSPLNTAPAKRLSIRTYVKPFDEGDICQDIDREIQRSGQVFFVHNAIGTIEQRTNELRALMPGVRFEFAHGQMEPAQLERIMASFYAKQFDVLVSTTIVEIGIDVPNANTMIIEKADNFGIAQLHQLRGRVGRSTRQAYCSLLTSDSVNDNGSKRLEAMVKASNLGEGSLLANHDLEMRGAGEILGEEQSGHLQKIGYPLYLRLLERAVDLIESNRVVNAETLIGDKIQLEVNLSGLIDRSYIEDESVRVSLYKRIASLNRSVQLEALVDEMIDRFGPLPEETANLLIAAQFRVNMRKIGIESMHFDNDGGRVQVSETAAITPHNLMDFCEHNPAKAKMVGPYSIRFHQKTGTRDDRINAVMDIVETLLNVEREQKAA